MPRRTQAEYEQAEHEYWQKVPKQFGIRVLLGGPPMAILLYAMIKGELNGWSVMVMILFGLAFAVQITVFTFNWGRLTDWVMWLSIVAVILLFLLSGADLSGNTSPGEILYQRITGNSLSNAEVWYPK